MSLTDSPRDTSQAAQDAGEACVFVVGMHRSGTSAATELIARLGIHAPRPDDRHATSEWNQRGNWESRKLTWINQRLLRELGGTWSSPPSLEAGWETDHALEELRAEAAAAFSASFDSRPMVWKDPQLCIVLPFWRTIVEPPVAAVLVYREPLEVARSLEARDGLPLILGLALWERYVRAACSSLEGIPTLVADYRRALEDPATWRRELGAFFSEIGLTLGGTEQVGAQQVLDPQMRHQQVGETVSPGPGDDAGRTVRALRLLDGVHHPWHPPELDPEPPWVADVIAMRHELEVARRTHRTLEASRAYRAVSWLRRRLHRS